MNQSVSNFNKIVDKSPQLASVLSTINSRDIKYGLYSGSHVSMLTSNRVPTDIDFLVADDDFAKLKNIFPRAQTREYSNVKFLYIGRHDEIEFASFSDPIISKNNEIEFISFSEPIVGNSHYSFRLSNLCWENSSLVESNDHKVRVLNEVDTILIKAMLQRGKDMGKHDLEDIEAILQQRSVDKKYLNERLLEVNQDQRLSNVLNKFKLL